MVGDTPDRAILVRFSLKTPYWPLSLSYGMFSDPNLRLTFHSIDQYMAYRMLARVADRETILWSPNGYVAHLNLIDIISSATASTADSPVISPTWNEDREEVLKEAVRLKYSQSGCALDILMRTGSREIFDVSREDSFMCHDRGKGMNAHGKALEALRARVKAGESIAVAS